MQEETIRVNVRGKLTGIDASDIMSMVDTTRHRSGGGNRPWSAERLGGTPDRGYIGGKLIDSFEAESKTGSVYSKFAKQVDEQNKERILLESNYIKKVAALDAADLAQKAKALSDQKAAFAELTLQWRKSAGTLKELAGELADAKRIASESRATEQAAPQGTASQMKQREVADRDASRVAMMEQLYRQESGRRGEEEPTHTPAWRRLIKETAGVIGGYKGSRMLGFLGDIFGSAASGGIAGKALGATAAAYGAVNLGEWWTGHTIGKAEQSIGYTGSAASFQRRAGTGEDVTGSISSGMLKRLGANAHGKGRDDLYARYSPQEMMHGLGAIQAKGGYGGTDALERLTGGPDGGMLGEVLRYSRKNDLSPEKGAEMFGSHMQLMGPQVRAGSSTELAHLGKGMSKEMTQYLDTARSAQMDVSTAIQNMEQIYANWQSSGMKLDEHTLSRMTALQANILGTGSQYMQARQKEITGIHTTSFGGDMGTVMAAQALGKARAGGREEYEKLLEGLDPKVIKEAYEQPNDFLFAGMLENMNLPNLSKAQQNMMAQNFPGKIPRAAFGPGFGAYGSKIDQLTNSVYTDDKGNLIQNPEQKKAFDKLQAARGGVPGEDLAGDNQIRLEQVKLIHSSEQLLESTKHTSEAFTQLTKVVDNLASRFRAVDAGIYGKTSGRPNASGNAYLGPDTPMGDFVRDTLGPIYNWLEKGLKSRHNKSSSESHYKATEQNEGVKLPDGGWKTSTAGARGPMQVLPSTFQDMKNRGKIPGDWSLDNEAQARAAGQVYLDEMVEQFGGDREKATAAYNAGPGRTGKAIKKYGDDYKSHLPDETQEYTRRVAKSFSKEMMGGGQGDVSVSVPLTIHANDALGRTLAETLPDKLKRFTQNQVDAERDKNQSLMGQRSPSSSASN